MFQQAADFWRRQEYEKTIETLEHAARLDPANAGIHLDLGRAYGLRYAPSDAERCFEKACQVAPRKLEALIEAGRRCQEFGNFEMARRYWERAAQDRSATPEVFLALAELQEKDGALAQATELAERAFKLQPGNPGAALISARLDRLSGRLPEAEERLRATVKAGSGDPWIRARLWYELGEVLDRQGRYDEAMEAFLEAKTLLRPAATTHFATLNRIQARMREMEQTITAPVLERWAAAAAANPESAFGPSRDIAILCGHPRSGTTLLEQVLDAHPQIIAAEETHILHDEAFLPLSRGFPPEASVLDVLESAPVSRLVKSREDYLRYTELFLGQKIGPRLLLDKNPALNVLIPAVARIFPEAKFLVAIRDPRDVCLSCFMQALAPNPVSSAYLSLEGTVTQYLSAMGFWQIMKPRLRNAFVEVRYEELVEDLPGVSGRVLEFLRLPWDEQVLRFDEHARNRLVRSPSYADVRKPISRRAIGRWQHYRRFLEPYLEKLEPMIRMLGYSV